MVGSTIVGAISRPLFRCLKQAAAALPDLALVHYHLGMSYVATGQDTKAAEEFKTALTKAPNSELEETIKAELRKTATQ